MECSKRPYSSVGQGNRSRHAWYVPDYPCGVSFPRQVFRQGHMTRAEAVHRAISQPDFHLASQIDDVLPPWGIVPIAKTARFRGPKDNPSRRLQRGQLRVGSQV